VRCWPIKDDAALKTIPTVILTTSEAQADILNSYQLQANCYLHKAVQFDAFERLMKSIIDFWLHRAKLPLIEDSGTLETVVGPGVMCAAP